MDALSGKWRDVRVATQKFCAIYNQIKDEKQSGVRDLDIVNHTLELYENETVQAYKWLDIFRLVKDKPKWKIPDACVLGQRNRTRDAYDGFTADQPMDLDEVEDDGDEDDGFGFVFIGQCLPNPYRASEPVEGGKNSLYVESKRRYEVFEVQPDGDASG